LSSAITVDEAVKKRPFTERFRFLIFFKPHRNEGDPPTRIWPIIRSLFFRCNEGTGSGTEDKKILDSSESRWPSLLAFANFFLAGRVHKPTMKVNIISRSDPVGRRSKQTANVVTRVGSKTCFVRFQTGNTSFFSDRVAVPDRERKWALCLRIRDLGCCSDESSETSTKIMTETLVPSRAELGHTTTHFDASSARHYLQGVCVTAPPIRGEPRRIPGHTAPLSESRA